MVNLFIQKHNVEMRIIIIVLIHSKILIDHSNSKYLIIGRIINEKIFEKCEHENISSIFLS